MLEWPGSNYMYSLTPPHLPPPHLPPSMEGRGANISGNFIQNVQKWFTNRLDKAAGGFLPLSHHQHSQPPLCTINPTVPWMVTTITLGTSEPFHLCFGIFLDLFRNIFPKCAMCISTFDYAMLDPDTPWRALWWCSTVQPGMIQCSRLCNSKVQYSVVKVHLGTQNCSVLCKKKSIWRSLVVRQRKMTREKAGFFRNVT